MALSVLLTVDLNQVNQAQREKFRDAMVARRWKRAKLTTTWFAEFTPETSVEGAFVVTFRDVREAANEAFISNYEVMAQVGGQLPRVGT